MHEHLRIWKNPITGDERGVDANLKDEWLVRLNGYQSLRLTSICEGHVGADNLNQNECPILRFQIVGCYTNHEIEGVLERVLIGIANRSDVKISHGWNGNIYYFDIDCLVKRTTDQMEESVSVWFESVIELLGKVDAALCGQIK